MWPLTKEDVVAAQARTKSAICPCTKEYGRTYEICEVSISMLGSEWPGTRKRKR